MIVADTSALLAVVFGEPDSDLYASALARDEVRLSAADGLEAHMVTRTRAGEAGLAVLADLIAGVVDQIVPFDHHRLEVALTAWDRFGNGRHPARLNFGDCMAYATAKLAGAPLLFKGNDFAQTDIASAL